MRKTTFCRAIASISVKPLVTNLVAAVLLHTNLNLMLSQSHTMHNLLQVHDLSNIAGMAEVWFRHNVVHWLGISAALEQPLC